jgi:hypothetical protein
MGVDAPRGVDIYGRPQRAEDLSRPRPCPPSDSQEVVSLSGRPN